MVYANELKASLVQDFDLLVDLRCVRAWRPTSSRSLCVTVCACVREQGSLLISCITAVISTLFITSSMCSVRFKILKSVICQHYEVNTHPQDWCPICHFAFHFAWLHIYHKDLTLAFVVLAAEVSAAGVCNSSTAEQTCF